MDARSIREHVEILVQRPEGVLRVLVTSERLFSSTTYIFIFWTIGSSVLLFGIAVIFMRNQVKTIRRLAYAADSFGKGKEVREFKSEGATVVRHAAAAFITMRAWPKHQTQQTNNQLSIGR